MLARCLERFSARTALAFALVAVIGGGSSALAQNQPGVMSSTAAGSTNSIVYKISSANERLEMIVNTSRILTLDKKIPKFVVNDRDKVTVTPLSAYQLQVAATKTGVTQINLWTEKDEIHTIDLIIYGDSRELSLLLEQEFPQSALKVRPLANSVVISGYVDRPDNVGRIIRMAEDYYPKVINNITVGGVQQVQLHCKVMEVSRTKLRALGFDFTSINGNDFLVSSVSGLVNAASVSGGNITGLGGDTVRFGVVSDNVSFFGFLQMMRQYDLLKVLAEPTLTTVSGRPAFFEVGGEFPVPVPQSLGTISIEFKKFGTRLDFVPIVLGNGNIRLEVRPSVSELDESRGVTLAGISIPAIRNRQVDTGVEMKVGQTLALAGLLQHRVEAQNVGQIWLADLPWFGAPFRRVREEVNEIELLVLVTPELVDAMDPEEVPPCGPGMHTVSPCDLDLYGRGHLEVPRCDGYCNGMIGGMGHGNVQPAPADSASPPPQGKPAPPSGQAPPPPAAKGALFRSRMAPADANPRNQVVRTSPPAAATPRAMPATNGVVSRPPTVTTGTTRTPATYETYDGTPAPNMTGPSQAPSRPSASSPASSSNGPGLIGPVGYDVVQ